MSRGASLCFGRRIKQTAIERTKFTVDVAHPALDSSPMAGQLSSIRDTLYCFIFG